MTEINEVLKDVLIKQIGGNIHDMVLVVNELPRSLFYRKNFPLIPEEDKFTGKLQGRLIRDRKAGKTKDELKPGVKFSQTGDGAFVFDINNQEGEQRFNEVNRYIIDNLPAGVAVPRLEFYCMEPGNPSSPPRPKHQLPRVELPVSSPPVSSNEDAVQASPSILPRKPGRPKKITQHVE